MNIPITTQLVIEAALDKDTRKEQIEAIYKLLQKAYGSGKKALNLTAMKRDTIKDAIFIVSAFATVWASLWMVAIFNGNF